MTPFDLLFDLERDHGRLVAAAERAVERAEDAAAYGALAEEVSDWSVGRHLEHLLLSDRGILDWLAPIARGEAPGPSVSGRGSAPGTPAGDGPGGAGGPTPVGWLVLVTGWIPRGRGSAPRMTVPEGRERTEVAAGLRAVLESARRLADDLERLDEATGRMPHPALGAFTPGQWLRFARIHHEHHEKIYEDVLRRAL